MTIGARALNFMGWYDGPDQTEPVHDPYRDGNCLCIICEQPSQDRDAIRTVSLRAAERPGVSFFYRVHKACDAGDLDETADIKAIRLMRELWLE